MSVYKVVDSKGKELHTSTTLHPGEIIKEELEARAILKKDFAKQIGMQPTHFSDLLKGKRHVSAKLAIILEQELGIDAEFWLRVQMAYDLAIARKELAMV